jgi:hypothetical protein
MAAFRLADPLRDKDLVRAAQRGADAMLDDDAAGGERITALIHRWLGHREDYGHV